MMGFFGEAAPEPEAGQSVAEKAMEKACDWEGGGGGGGRMCLRVWWGGGEERRRGEGWLTVSTNEATCPAGIIARDRSTDENRSPRVAEPLSLNRVLGPRSAMV